MKRFVALLALVALLTVNRAEAQSMGSSYRTAVGVKFWPGALTVKHFIRDDRALEGLFSFWGHGFRFTGLYEIHGNFADAQGLKWYVGPGAHVGFYDYHDDHNHHIDGVYIGIDGVLGLDYKFNGAPINISIDWQPSFEFGEYVGFAHYGGIGFRYTF